MRKTRFWWKLYAGYFLLILITAATVGILVDQNAQRDALEDIERDLMSQALLLGEVSQQALQGNGAQELQARIRPLRGELQSRLTVMRADGTVIADSHRDPSEMGDHSGRPEIIAARRNGKGKETRWSETVEETMLYIALRQGSADDPVGFVRTSLSMDALHERQGRMRHIVILGGILAALFALALGYLVARQVTRPLDAMNRAAAELTEDVYVGKIEVRSNDEIGQLGRSFNRMAGALRERMQVISEDRSKLLAIVHSMVEGLVAVDQDGRIVHMNRSAGKLLDIDEPEVLGRPLQEATRLHPVSELMARSMREDERLRSELVLRSRSGSRVVEVHASPLKDGEDQTVGAVMVLHDLTTLRHLERVRSDFVANVSHELKTPVTAIRGLVETLLDDPAVDGGTRNRFLGKIQRQTDRLSSLVRDLLTISRLESGELNLDLVPMDLRTPLRDSIQSLAPHAEAGNITVIDELGDEPVPIQGDHEAVRQIVDNLLSNAINYTGEGGQVRVGLGHAENEVVLEVSDTGVGIEAPHLARIFERFYRIDKARSRSQGGTGLGLSIVKHRLQSLGGRIEVESTPGEGSTFRAYFPVGSREARETGISASSTSPV